MSSFQGKDDAPTTAWCPNPKRLDVGTSTWDADFWPMIKENRLIQVLKNHHIPNCIPSCASLQLFTRLAILLVGGALFAVLAEEL